MDKPWELTFNLGEKIPGKELLSILQKIDATGSLRRAVEEADVSYRYGWGLLKRAEEALGTALVLRQTGGSAGGGTTLTQDGRKLLGHMQALQREVHGQLSALLYEQREDVATHLMVASTMEPVVTGLLDVLEQAYLQETGVIVSHIAAGSGQAISMAKAGRVDIILTHAPELEERFIEEAWGTRRVPVMMNDFIIVGPPADPAKTKGVDNAKEVFNRIAKSQANFISRGDRSGTHLFERALWKDAGFNPVGAHWYHEIRNTLGNYGILSRAAELAAYTLVDSASFLTGGFEEKLSVMQSGDPQLTNIFSLMPVSRKKAAVNQEEAERFATWVASSAAKKIIGEFGKKQFGVPLFRTM